MRIFYMFKKCFFRFEILLSAFVILVLVFCIQVRKELSLIQRLKERKWQATHHTNISVINVPGHSDVAAASNYIIYEHRDTEHSAYDVSKVKLEFLPQCKNPCWMERYPGRNVYRNNMFIKNKNNPNVSKWGFHEDLLNLNSKGVSIQLPGECSIKNTCRLRCLPYFMVIGVAKSGMTDIQKRIVGHPNIFPACEKELLWWSQYRYSINATLSDYSDLFDVSLKQIIKNDRNIVGEFTSMTFYDIAHWRHDPENANLSEPKRTLVHDIKAVLPNIKLIVIMRNPTFRLYSQYNMFYKEVGTPEDFHIRVMGSIEWWEMCVKRLPARNCIYGSPPSMPPIYDLLGDNTQWWPRDKNYSGEIRFGMYGLIIKDWLNVFPRKNFLFLKTEEYSANLVKAYNEEIFPFLGEVKLTDRQMGKAEIVNEKPVKSKQYKYGPMLIKTKFMLDEFYSPFNNKLAVILQDDKWLWKN